MTDPDIKHTEEDPAVASRMGHAFKWSVVTQVVARAGGFTLGLILARLLAPEEFGVYTIALSTFTILLTVDDLGLRQALVRYAKFDAAVPTARTISVVTGAAFYAIAWFLAGPIASLTNTPEAAGVIRLLCVGLLIDTSLHVVPAAALHRRFRQDLWMVTELFALGATALVTIGLALADYGPRALALGTVAGQLAMGASAQWLAKVPWKFGVDRTTVRELLTMSVPFAAASVVGAALLNVDYLVVGRVMDAAAVGLYLLAFNVSNWPISVVGASVRAAAVPGFANLQEDSAEAQRVFRRGLMLLAGASIPFCAVLITVPQQVLGFMYGHRWEGGAGALRFLAALAFIRLVGGFVDDVVFAMGRSRLLLFKNFAWLVALVPVMYAFVHHDGVRGAGIAQALVGLAVVAPLLVLMCRQVGVWSPGVGIRLAALVPVLAGLVALGRVVASALSGTFLVLTVTSVTQLLAFAALAWPARHWFLSGEGLGDDLAVDVVDV